MLLFHFLWCNTQTHSPKCSRRRGWSCNTRHHDTWLHSLFSSVRLGVSSDFGCLFITSYWNCLPRVLGSLVLTLRRCVSVKLCITREEVDRFPSRSFSSALTTIISDSAWNILKAWRSGPQCSIVAQGMCYRCSGPFLLALIHTLFI